MQQQNSLSTESECGLTMIHSPSPFVWQYNEIYNFNGCVTINQTDWTSIGHYERKLTTPKLAFIQVSMTIPFVGNNKGGTRSRILLKFDDHIIGDATKFNTHVWEVCFYLFYFYIIFTLVYNNLMFLFVSFIQLQ